MATTEEPVLQAETVAEAVATEPSKDEKPPGKPTKKTAASKGTKHKNPAAPRKRGSPSHPPYFEMIQDAIVTLKDRTGSSQYAITKFNEEKQKNLPPNFKKILLVQLRKLVASGKLVKVKASYKLPSGPPSAPAKKKPALAAKPKATASKTSKPKKVTVPKAKTAAKTKPASKVKPAAKTKPASKVKPAAKTKPASKAKPAAKTKPASKTKPAKKLEAVADLVKPKAALKRKEPEKDNNKKKPAAKAAKVSSIGSPGKKKAAVAKKAVAKKAPAKSVKPKSVKSPVRKATARRGNK